MCNVKSVEEMSLVRSLTTIMTASIDSIFAGLLRLEGSSAASGCQKQGYDILVMCVTEFTITAVVFFIVL